jgi:hypothetical protein
MLLGLHARLDSIANKCEADGASALSISAIDKMRLQLADIARLQGFAGSGTDRSVNVHVGVAISADQIASSLSTHMGSVSRAQALEAMKQIEVPADE